MTVWNRPLEDPQCPMEVMTDNKTEFFVIDSIPSVEGVQ